MLCDECIFFLAGSYGVHRLILKYNIHIQQYNDPIIPQPDRDYLELPVCCKNLIIPYLLAYIDIVPISVLVINKYIEDFIWIWSMLIAIASICRHYIPEVALSK